MQIIIQHLFQQNIIKGKILGTKFVSKEAKQDQLILMFQSLKFFIQNCKTDFMDALL